ncbi:hypothetical protein AO354_37890 [Pseudomonas syringae pv. syringae]|nr:hypothetical protein AO354_37890 [Pseudomonas syringae pv. syringae]
MMARLFIQVVRSLLMLPEILSLIEGFTYSCVLCHEYSSSITQCESLLLVVMASVMDLALAMLQVGGKK